MAYHQVQGKGGRVQKSPNAVTAHVHLLELENRTLGRQSWQIGHLTRHLITTYFTILGENTGFSKTDTALKATSHQQPADAPFK